MSSRLVLVAGMIFGFLAICGVGLFYVYGGGFSWSPAEESTEWGIFGDYFGGVLGAIFGFSSFVLLLVTVLLQQDQLNKLHEDSLKQNHISYMNEIYSDITYLFTRKIDVHSDIEFGDVVVGGASLPERPSEGDRFQELLSNLLKYLSEYSSALSLYEDNFDSFFQYRAHRNRVVMLANFVRSHELKLRGMEGPSLGLIFHMLERKREK